MSPKKKRKPRVKDQVKELVKGKRWNKHLSKTKMDLVDGLRMFSPLWAGKILLGYLSNFARHGRTIGGLAGVAVALGFLGLHFYLKRRFSGYWAKPDKRIQKLSTVPKKDRK